MSKKTLFFLLLFLTGEIYSQNIIQSPDVATSTALNVIITKIIKYQDSTVLYFKTISDGSISIPQTTYIQAGEDTAKLFVQSATGIKVGRSYNLNGNSKYYSLTFPSINSAAKTLNYGEAGGEWFINRVSLEENKNDNLIPTKYFGPWFSNSNNDIIAFYNKHAIYKSQVWDYSDIHLKNGIVSFKIINHSQIIPIKIKSDNDSLIILNISNKVPINFTHTDKKLNREKGIDENEILKPDTAIYSGYVNNYTKEAKIFTGTIFVNNSFTGNQDNYTFRTDSQGYFFVKIPMAYPEDVFLRFVDNGSVFLAPGKKLFQIIDYTYGNIYTDDLGPINSELYNKLAAVSLINDYSLTRKWLAVNKPAAYKDSINLRLLQALNRLEEIRKHGDISERAYQIKKISLNNDALENLLSYDLDYKGYLISNRKIKSYDDSIPGQSQKMHGYYDFLKAANFNKDFLMSSSSYFIINRLLYLDDFRPAVTGYYTSVDFIDELNKNNINDSLLSDLKHIENARNSIDTEQYKRVQPYLKTQDSLIKKMFPTFGKKYFKNTGNKNMGVNFLIYLKDSANIPIKEEVITALKNYENSSEAAQRDSLSKKQMDVYSKIENKYQILLVYKRSEESRKSLVNNYKPYISNGDEILFPIFKTQDIFYSITKQMNVALPSEISILQQKISNDFIRNYFTVENIATQNKIIEDKKNTQSKINELSNTEVKDILQSITSKYKGKVIYLDFWATWCGPCLAGIQEIKPLKEEYKSKDIIFVYVTDQSSPEQTWKNMTPGINGEHYRVNEDQWRNLSGFFNISGIPHYVLINKKGTIVNKGLGFKSSDELKGIFNNLIDEK